MEKERIMSIKSYYINETYIKSISRQICHILVYNANSKEAKFSILRKKALQAWIQSVQSWKIAYEEIELSENNSYEVEQIRIDADINKQYWMECFDRFCALAKDGL
jgi:hypothetical protein